MSVFAAVKLVRKIPTVPFLHKFAEVMFGILGAKVVKVLGLFFLEPDLELG